MPTISSAGKRELPPLPHWHIIIPKNYVAIPEIFLSIVREWTNANGGACASTKNKEEKI
jgi:hypothetical protein